MQRVGSSNLLTPTIKTSLIKLKRQRKLAFLFFPSISRLFVSPAFIRFYPILARRSLADILVLVLLHAINRFQAIVFPSRASHERYPSRFSLHRLVFHRIGRQCLPRLRAHLRRSQPMVLHVGG
ncbi:hypothetical protein CV_1356 [Chromobacterium violaceum ATCC 12472]|uniref:Uncharacterized protein n=1 Tax=Chromobacterium violaceum (strain ATCC 12472 / DSM 30191 / JCM 1249 / CCUG 213 / NBRC 12614 / NCIMB 9131 / NCTC 9757 / MK) TaxID=243365 RepID=Q7NYB8_CHRVO|nr:hypothetical protein CV_1356 [Chromobacterium violaceum ATCC 12472]